MLNLADKIVFEKTGQHLDDLQEAVLQGTLQHETYKQIAKDLDCSESRVRNAASQLWQLLSQESGEDINKKNFRAAINRFQVSNVSNFAQNVNEQHISGSFNICGDSRHPSNIPNSNPSTKQTSNPQQTQHQDLSEMPELGTFYSRTPELDTLTTCILQQQCRLISLTGITGIGKTSLAVKLVQQIKQEFDYILWHTINPSDTLNELQYQLTQLFTPSENIPLIKYFQKHRSLIILDDVHNLFSTSELSGKYKPEQEEYRSFFNQIQKLPHQSCFILIGWEHPRELPQNESKNTPIRTLQLTGLPTPAARQILNDKGLSPIDNY
ncbi:ATP-binding protein [Ancylothrix sp. D3o]|uniref:ATP-binding protein n=1 Tax=Ancylothrix sp. D3o TaxID=2953691 RepID=UPI00294FF054|nr:ATP-binding protein [Ancylothrix sp. D3o]